MARNASVIWWSDESVHAFSMTTRGGRAQVIGEGKLACRVPDSLFAPHDSSDLIGASVQALQEANGLHGQVTLVLPMQWYFLQALENKGSKKSDETLAFEFEPFLPLSLEDVTCSFVRLSSETCLGVAIATQPMADLLGAFSRAGIEIDHIAVDTLVGMELQGRSKLPRSIIVNDSRWVRAVVFDPENKVFTSAVVTAAETRTIDQVPLARLSVVAQNADPLLNSAAVLPVADSTHDATMQNHAIASGQEDQSIHELQLIDLAKFVALNPPELDLRTGDLAGSRKLDEIGKLSRQCMGLAALLLIVISASMFHQARSLARHQKQIDAQKLAVYRQVFETSSLPPSAAMRLASERVRLEGLARTDVDSSKSKVAILPPPFVALRSIVDALPSDVPILLNEARIDEHQLTMRGQTREHRDAERIVEAINKVQGVKALAPRTNRLKSRGVEFSINAGASNGQ